MSRYIDADILRAEILKHKRETSVEYERHNEIIRILGIVNRQPEVGVIGIDDIKNIINEELRYIDNMKPENGKNGLIVDVLKMNYRTECRVIESRIDALIRDLGEAEIQKPKKVLRKVLPKTGNANGTDNCKCPECKISLNMKYKRCPCCGQALDWRGME